MEDEARERREWPERRQSYPAFHDEAPLSSDMDSVLYSTSILCIWVTSPGPSNRARCSSSGPGDTKKVPSASGSHVDGFIRKAAKGPPLPPPLSCMMLPGTRWRYYSVQSITFQRLPHLPRHTPQSHPSGSGLPSWRLYL
jgi:hypothetical protein